MVAPQRPATVRWKIFVEKRAAVPSRYLAPGTPSGPLPERHSNCLPTLQPSRTASQHAHCGMQHWQHCSKHSMVQQKRRQRRKGAGIEGERRPKKKTIPLPTPPDAGRCGGSSDLRQDPAISADFCSCKVAGESAASAGFAWYRGTWYRGTWYRELCPRPSSIAQPPPPISTPIPPPRPPHPVPRPQNLRGAPRRFPPSSALWLAFFVLALIISLFSARHLPAKPSSEAAPSPHTPSVSHPSCGDPALLRHTGCYSTLLRRGKLPKAPILAWSLSHITDSTACQILPTKKSKHYRARSSTFPQWLAKMETAHFAR